VRSMETTNTHLEDLADQIAATAWCNQIPDRDLRSYIAAQCGILMPATQERLREMVLSRPKRTWQGMRLQGSGEPFLLEEGEIVESITDNGDGTADVRVRGAGVSSVFTVDIA
jgi:hypothetical protein